MKKPYTKPEICKVELKSEEGILSCGKCPGNANVPRQCNLRVPPLPTKQS